MLQKEETERHLATSAGIFWIRIREKLQLNFSGYYIIEYQ
jgi:hypothetical protein